MGTHLKGIVQGKTFIPTYSRLKVGTMLSKGLGSRTKTRLRRLSELSEKIKKNQLMMY